MLRVTVILTYHCAEIPLSALYVQPSCKHRPTRTKQYEKYPDYIPLPYRVGETFWPDNADEELRCVAGTYVWLQQPASSISIPRLYGFGL